ncbi:hypothetical protein [Nocardia gipuzkoensis]|uniref:hypothetical protein n=1 Tax=Nocardia gipuzkoensis TaxID=2749991 RepID=UPI003EDF9887
MSAGQLDSVECGRGPDRLGGAGTAGCADDVELILRAAATPRSASATTTTSDLLFI